MEINVTKQGLDETSAIFLKKTVSYSSRTEVLILVHCRGQFPLNQISQIYCIK